MIRRTLPILLLLASVTAWTQTQHPAPRRSASHARNRSERRPAPSVADRLDALRSEMQQQNAAMQQQNAAMQQRIGELEQQLRASQREVSAMKEAAAVEAVRETEQARELSAGSQSVATLQTAVSELKTNTATLVSTVQQERAKVEAAMQKPPAIHYKGLSFTPGGFMAEESVWRQREQQADIASPFNAIPFSGSNLASLSEFRMTARQTRFSLLTEAQGESAKLATYLEFDLLGAGLTSNSNESNSYMPRLRHAWLESKWRNGWSVDAGQMWTLAESNRKGISPIAANVYAPDMIDAQYVVGFTWLRQPGVRLIRNFDNRVWVGIAAEGAQTALSARNAPASFLYCSPGTTNLTSTVNYSFDKAPDVLAKVAFDPGVGHYEVKGLARFFRDRIYPNGPNSAAGAYNDNVPGSGFGAAASWTIAKKVDFSLNALAGHGVGRYGTSQLPDVTVRPDGRLTALPGAQALATLEFNPSSRLKLYAYGGDEYAGRRAYVNAKGAGVGYGSPLNNVSGCGTEMAPSSSSTPATGLCNADTRTIYQGVFGFWYRPYVGPRGRVQYGVEYSYTTRFAWSGVGGAPEADQNMVFTSVRYYLP